MQFTLVLLATGALGELMAQSNAHKESTLLEEQALALLVLQESSAIRLT